MPPSAPRVPPRKAVALACTRLRLACGTMEEFRDGAGSGFRLGPQDRLDGAPVVARIRYASLAAGARWRVGIGVQVAQWLAEQDFPTIRPADLPQPAEAEGWLVTFWEDLPREPCQGDDVLGLSRLLRKLHRCTDPPFELPPPRPFGSLRDDIARCAWLTPNERGWLATELQRLEQDYHDAELRLGTGLIHGDARPAIVLRSGGQAYLHGWDFVARGPRELDFAPVALRRRFGGGREEWRKFCAAYGLRLNEVPHGLRVLVRLRELRTLTPGLRGGDPGARAETRRRLNDLMSGTQTTPWHPPIS